jgi:hypothetical protein
VEQDVATDGDITEGHYAGLWGWSGNSFVQNFEMGNFLEEESTDSGRGSSASRRVIRASKLPAWVFPWMDELPCDEEDEEKQHNEFDLPTY